MNIRLSVHEQDADLLRSLHEWLREEPELRGRVKPEQRPPRPGEMGSVTDVLLVTVSGGGAATALFTSLRTWFAQPRRSDVEIKVVNEDGSEVWVNAKRVADVDRLVKDVLGG